MKKKIRLIKKGKTIWLALSCMLVMSIAALPAFAGHPLITDDTGTQGQGKFQMELTGEYERDDTKGARTKVTTIEGVLTAGLTETIDIVLGVPFQYGRLVEDTEDGRERSSEKGISDVSAAVKWRFFDRNGLSFAVKPGVTFPTGNDDKGLGGGRMTYGIDLISSLEVGPACLHANVGYVQNENKSEERKELWHASLAAEIPVLENLALVADIGTERNSDFASRTNPVFLLGGIVYSPNEDIDLSFGVKGGLNDVAPDYALLAGLTFRF